MTNIPELRKRKKDGTLYRRPVAVLQAIEELSNLLPSEVVRRSQIRITSDEEYVRTECLVHFVRNLTFGADSQATHDLFSALLSRIDRMAVPELSWRENRGIGSQQLDLLEIKEQILEKFQDLLCANMNRYEDRLDIYECRFNFALCALRKTAFRDVQNRLGSFESLSPDPDSSDPSIEVEESYAKHRESEFSENLDFLYRSKLQSAINSLRPEDKEVMELRFQGFLISSEDENELTIVKILDCSDKTARTRRNRALKQLEEALKEDGE